MYTVQCIMCGKVEPCARAWKICSCGNFMRSKYYKPKKEVKDELSKRS